MSRKKKAENSPWGGEGGAAPNLELGPLGRTSEATAIQYCCPTCRKALPLEPQVLAGSTLNPDAGRAIHWGGVGRDKKSHLARVLAWPLRPQASIALSWSRAPGDPASFVFASTESSLPREGTVCPMPQMEGLRGWRKEIQSLFPIYSYHARLGSNIH